MESERIIWAEAHIEPPTGISSSRARLSEQLS